MKKAGIPIVVVLVSGRPMILDKILEKGDALVAGWLPGSEGQGVSDVLFVDFKPSGKLSHSWPRTMSQIPVNIGDVTHDPLFKYGYGLTYQPHAALLADPVPAGPRMFALSVDI